MRYPVCKLTDRAAVVAWARRLKKRHVEFSLTVLPSGYWCKKIGGRQVTFGPLRDPNEALAAYHAYMTGDVASGDRCSVDELVNRYLAAMNRRCESGSLTYSLYAEYMIIAKRVIETFGRERAVESLRPDDYVRLRTAFAKTRSGKGLSHAVNYTRQIITWGQRNHLIDVRDRYGTEFCGPTRRELRLIAESKPMKMFQPDRIRDMIDPVTIGQHFRANRTCWRAMVMLAINAAFTSIDVSDIIFDEIDLDASTHTFRRPKTLAVRRAVLWPETVQAIRNYLPDRSTPQPGCKKLVFLNSAGGRWIRPATAAKSRVDNISKHFIQYLRRLGDWQPGLGFSTFRHVFATIARETGERDAIELALGHVPDGVTAEFYLERVPDSGLRRIADHVRVWLFGKDD